MKRRCRGSLTLLLLLLAAPAWADWVKLAESSNAVYYIDTATISEIGELRRFWAIQDMREANPGGIASIRALEEYDCAKARFRYLSVSAHSGPMAGGQILLANDLDDDWSYIPPGANSLAIQEMVCTH